MLEEEPFERFHRAVIHRVISEGDNPDCPTSSLVPLVFEKRTHLLNPLSLHVRNGPLSIQTIQTHVGNNPQFQALYSPDAINAIAETSKLVLIDVDDMLELYVKALKLSYDPYISGAGYEYESSTSIYQHAGKLVVGLYRRELYCLVLSIHDLIQAAPRNKLAAAIVSDLAHDGLAKNLIDLVVGLLKDLSTAEQSDLLICIIKQLANTLLNYYCAFPAKSSDEVDSLLGLIPQALGGTTSLRYPSLVSANDLDFVLQDGGQASGYLNLRFGLTVISLLNPKSEKFSLTRMDLERPGISERSSVTSLLVTDSALATKLKDELHWSEQTELGRLLAFAISGVFLEDSKYYRNALVYWSSLDSLRVNILEPFGDCEAVAETVEGLISSLILPLHRWVVLKKLDVYACKHALISPEKLQTSTMLILSDLCRLNPLWCEKYRDVLLDRTEVFHNAPAPTHMAAQPVSSLLPLHAHNLEPYAAVLELASVMLSRAPTSTAVTVGRKLSVHHNQWFNFGRIIESLVKVVRQGGSAEEEGVSLVSVLEEISRLVGAGFSCRLGLTGSAPAPISWEVKSWPGSPLLDLVLSLQQHLCAPALKAAALDALSCMQFTPSLAANALSAAAPALPRLLIGDAALTASALRFLLVVIQNCSPSDRWIVCDLESIINLTLRHALLLFPINQDITLLSLKLMRFVALAPADHPAVSFLFKSLRSVDSPVWTVVADLARSKNEKIQATALDLIRIALQRENLVRDSPLISQLLLQTGVGAEGPSAPRLLTSLLVEISRPKAIKPLVYILIQLVDRYPDQTASAINLLPFVSRTVSAALGDALLGFYGEEPRIEQLPVEWSAEAEDVFHHEVRGSLCRVPISMLTGLPVSYQNEMIWLAELNGSAMLADLQSSNEDLCMLYYFRKTPLHILEASLFYDDSTFTPYDPYNRYSTRLMVLMLLRASLCSGGANLAAMLLGLKKQIDGYAPDETVGDSSAISALFFLLDNPPPKPTLEFSEALELPALLLCVTDLSKVALKYVEFSWVYRFKLLRDTCLALAGDEALPRHRALKMVQAATSLFSAGAIELFAVAGADAGTSHGLGENVQNMREVANAFFVEDPLLFSQVLRSAAIALSEPDNSVIPFELESAVGAAKISGFIDPAVALCSLNHTTAQSESLWSLPQALLRASPQIFRKYLAGMFMRNLRAAAQRALCQFGLAAAAFAVSCAGFLESRESAICRIIEEVTLLTLPNEEDALAMKASVISSLSAAVAAYDTTFVVPSGFAVRHASILVSFVDSSRLDKATTEKVVTSICLLLAHFRVMEQADDLEALKSLHNYGRLVELMAEWAADDNKVVAPTLAALLAVDDSKDASDAIERHWLALSKGKAADVIEVLCRRPEFASRAIELSLLLPEHAKLDQLVSTCLSLPNNELAWELSDWIYRSNTSGLQQLLKIDTKIAK